MSFIVKALKLDRFEPDRIVTSNIVSPFTLAILRGFVCLYSLVVIISEWATSESAAGYFMYFTNLTYLGLTIYLVCSTLWSFSYLRQPKSDRAQWLKSGSPWWGYIHWLLYATIVTFHVIVPIVFWTMLANYMKLPTGFGAWQNASVHAVDGVFAVFELIFNRHFLQPIHSFVVAGVMVSYMFLTFIYHKTSGIWVYPFLDWSQGPIAAAYYIGIAVGLFIIYFALLVLHKHRNKWLAGRCARVNHDHHLESIEDHKNHDEEEAYSNK
ncbi:hypothetical protein BGX26_008553 [Mortierella sp. AD094]|nr:hypothetical protein BGX26_008553 [Mortierella sp. AD094]